MIDSRWLMSHLDYDIWGKFKYECICQQWLRCVFAEQTCLVVNGSRDTCRLWYVENSWTKLVLRQTSLNSYYRITVLDKVREVVLRKCPEFATSHHGCECDNECCLSSQTLSPFGDIECELIAVDATICCTLGPVWAQNSEISFRLLHHWLRSDETVSQFVSKLHQLIAIFSRHRRREADFLSRLRPSGFAPTYGWEKLRDLWHKYSNGKNSLKYLTIYGNSQCYGGTQTHIRISSYRRSLSTSAPIPARPTATGMRALCDCLTSSGAHHKLWVFISVDFFAHLGGSRAYISDYQSKPIAHKLTPVKRLAINGLSNH